MTALGAFRVDAVVAGIRGRRAPVPVCGLLVDSGSEFTWIPEAFLRSAGVTVAK
jgi:hypothetical protein